LGIEGVQKVTATEANETAGTSDMHFGRSNSEEKKANFFGKRTYKYL
jgi:hypothetical protein